VRTYSTQEAAELVGIHHITLHRWLGSRKVRASQAIPMKGNKTMWRWAPADVQKLRKYKAVSYRKGRGRRKTKRR
jgi:hypothetical protein